MNMNEEVARMVVECIDNLARARCIEFASKRLGNCTAESEAKRSSEDFKKLLVDILKGPQITE